MHAAQHASFVAPPGGDLNFPAERGRALVRRTHGFAEFRDVKRILYESAHVCGQIAPFLLLWNFLEINPISTIINFCFLVVARLTKWRKISQWRIIVVYWNEETNSRTLLLILN